MSAIETAPVGRTVEQTPISCVKEPGPNGATEMVNGSSPKTLVSIVYETVALLAGVDDLIAAPRERAVFSAGIGIRVRVRIALIALFTRDSDRNSVSAFVHEA